MNDITYGGFIPSNIRRWIIKECIESGDPVNFFSALSDAMADIDYEEANNDDFWNNVNTNHPPTENRIGVPASEQGEGE